MSECPPLVPTGFVAAASASSNAVASSVSSEVVASSSSSSSGFSWGHAAFALGGVAIAGAAIWLVAGQMKITVSKKERSQRKQERMKRDQRLHELQQQQERQQRQTQRPQQGGGRQQAGAMPGRTAARAGPSVPSGDDTPDERKCLLLLSSLVSAKGVDLQVKLIDELHIMSRDTKTHDAMRDTGVLSFLMKLLTGLSLPHSADPQQLQDFDRIAASLTKVLSNLAANKPNREIMGESTTIKDLLVLLDTSRDENVMETVLRALMNLAISPENEDRIRDEGGLPRFIAILKDKDASPKIALQNARVLVNLSGNDMNRIIMLQEGGAERVLELLFSTTRIGLLYRIVRLLGAFSTGCELPLYEKLATKQVAQRLVELLRNQGPPEQLITTEGKEEERALAEVIMLTIWKLASERPPKYRAVTEQFQSVFLDGGLDLIFAYLQTNDTMAISGSLNALLALSKNNARVKAYVRQQQDVLGRVNSLSSSKVPQIKEKVAEIIQEYATLESLD